MTDDPDINVDPVVGEGDGPPDPSLHPARSPGVGEDVDGLEDIDISREDVDIGEADPADLTAADTGPVADEATASLVADLQRGSPSDRQRAALALADHDPTDATIEALRAAARGDSDADVRQFAVEALAELAVPEGSETALAALGDEDPWVRAEAVVALDGLDRERYGDAIEACLSDDHHAVRRNALVSLWKRRGTDAEETLLGFVDDESDRVREWVATLLGEIDNDRAEQALRTLAADDHDVVARTAADAFESRDGEAGTADPAATSARRSSDPDRAPHDTPPDL